MTYTPPPPSMAQPVQPVGKDNTKLFGWIGIIGGLCCGIIGLIFGILSIAQAKKWGNTQALGWIAIVIGVLNIIGGFVWNVNR
jgi:hypothetical protein